MPEGMFCSAGSGRVTQGQPCVPNGFSFVSGSPLICITGDEQPVLHGVTFFEAPYFHCYLGSMPGLYTRVTDVTNWITNTMDGKAIASSSRSSQWSIAGVTYLILIFITVGVI